MGKHESSSPIGIGAISIMTVLLVLSLTLFSALTLTSARADLALSQRNADSVSAYYRADREAVRLYGEFAADESKTLDTQLPITEGQVLSLSLQREQDGSVTILSWRTAPAMGDEDFNSNLPVWDGTFED